MKNTSFSLKHMMILYNVFVLNIIGLILSQLGISEQMEHCKRKLSSSKVAFIEVPGVAETQDNVFLQQVVAQFVSKLFGKNHREICYSFSYCFFFFFAHALQPLESIGNQTRQKPQGCCPSLERAVQWSPWEPTSRTSPLILLYCSLVHNPFLLLFQ